MNIIEVPTELKERRCWLLWRNVTRDGKPTKVPFCATTGSPASTTNPDTWATLDQAQERLAAGGFDGLGLVLTDGLCGVDVDHCVNEAGELDGRGRQILESLDTYAERSPSGTGLHLLLWANLPTGRRKSTDREVEIYGPGSPRYLTFTGDLWPGARATIEPRQEQLDALHAYLFPPAGVETERPAAAPPDDLALTDDELLDVAFASANGPSIRALFNEPGAPGNSEGDAALAGKLAFYSGGDPARLERLMRRSARVRDKWDTLRSGERWISLECRRALDRHTGEYFSSRKRREPAPPEPPADDQEPMTDDPADDQEPQEPEQAKRRPIILSFHHTDAGNAELLAHLCGERLRYDHRRGRWLIFRRGRWEPDNLGELKRLAKGCARRRQTAAADANDDPGRKWGFSSESAAKITAALDLAKSEPPIADDGADWDADPYLLGVPNGVVDLRTGEPRPGAPGDQITKWAGTAFDPAATCPRWDRFLEEVFAGDQELIFFVWLACGYSLTGDMSEQCFFLLHGRGSNGKSVFLNVLRHLAGDYGANTGFATFEASDRAGIACDVVTLDGARLVTASETGEAAKLNEARIKAWTGRDPMTARALYSMPFTFSPCGKLWLACNHRPRVQDDSLGFWRRVRLIPFTKSFDPQAEPDLEEKLLAELPGILTWAVAGAGAWYSQRLSQPDAVKIAGDKWRETADTLGDFLATYCQIGDSLRVASGELYKAYLEYCEELQTPQRERLTQQAFGRRMSDRFDQTRLQYRGKLTRTYLGIGLLSERQIDGLTDTGA